MIGRGIGLPLEWALRVAYPQRLGRRGDLTQTLRVRRHTNEQMGRQLVISPKTVGRRIEHIYQKFGVSSRAAAVKFAAEHDLLR